MKQLLYVLVVLSLAACNKTGKFVVEGNVEGGTGEKIYLEYSGLMKSTLLDSTTINKKGEFRFKAPSPEYPDFYRLKLGNKQIYFAVDSTETITIKSTFDEFSTDYSITGSMSNTDIQILRKSLAKIQSKANQIIRGMKEEERLMLQEDLLKLIEEHKVTARTIILKNPKSTAAYFAIYQKVNDVYVFSPYAKEDKPYCAAVATSYNAFMPEYDRSKNLYGLVMDAIKTEREIRKQEALSEMIANASTGYLEIELPNIQGVKRKLSELQGKVILLDFSAFESRESVAYTFALRELYNKYASRGFEIYQVSLDRNKLLWEESIQNLPWVCVRDENGPQTIAATTYNVTSIPTYFLISKAGEIIGRDLDRAKLIQEIEKQVR